VDKVAAIDASRPLIVTISDGVNEWTLGDTVLVGEVTRRYLGPPEPSPPPVEPESEPPVILQCDPRWADEIYAVHSVVTCYSIRPRSLKPSPI
jgi:hypothetical protein